MSICGHQRNSPRTLKKVAKALIRWVKEDPQLSIRIQAFKDEKHRQRYAYAQRQMDVINAKKFKKRLEREEEERNRDKAA